MKDMNVKNVWRLINLFYQANGTRLQWFMADGFDVDVDVDVDIDIDVSVDTDNELNNENDNKCNYDDESSNKENEHSDIIDH